jgi:hypothetical protein
MMMAEDTTTKHQRRVLLFEIVPQALCGCDEGSLLLIDSGGGESEERGRE